MIGIEYIGVMIPIVALMIPIVAIASSTIVKMKKLELNKSTMGSQEAIDELYFSIKEMKKRINNLETILYDQEKRS
ncbi:MAG: hypothetical protein PF518_10400 [Spirochaetaceae bacterium]|jgi:hypothetical protein|nr:hypothetical protein [Spirochaetaceae bacterium]